MPRGKWLVSSVFISIVVAAAGYVALIASADAAECKKEANRKFVLCLGEPLRLTEGTLKLHIFSKTGSHITLHTAGITLECAEILLTISATITGTATSVLVKKLVLHCIKSRVTAPAHCAVENELWITSPLAGVMKSKEVLLLLPESGTGITIITFTSSGGTCLVAGKLKVTTEKGNTEEGPLVNMPEIEKSLRVHVVESTGGGTSHLLLGEEPAEMTGSFNIETELSELWAVIEGK